MARSAGLISLATMLSRILGLVREQLFAALLGASAFADAFKVAFRIPNLLRDLFAEGAMSQAFIPTLKSVMAKEGTPRGYALANRLAGTLLILISAIVLIAAWRAPDIVGVLASDFQATPNKFDITVLLTRILFPYLPLISLAAIAMGVLNAQYRFAGPALAPAAFNVCSILAGCILLFFDVTGTWVVIGWALGTLAGGVCQLGIQVPLLWKVGFRIRLRADVMWRDPGMRQVAQLMAPAIIGLAAVQVNIIVNTFFAAQEAGAVSWLDYAFRFLQFPIGVFGVAVATVSTTRYADAATSPDPGALTPHLVESLRLIVFLTVPATVGLFVLGEDIIRLIYERGAFTANDSQATTLALEFYLVGLVAYGSVKVVAPAFYALRRARVAVFGSMSAVATNIALNVILYPIYGFKILALGVAAAATVNIFVLLTIFHRAVAPLPIGTLLGHLFRVVLVGALMGACTWGSRELLRMLEMSPGLGANLLYVLPPVFLSALVFLGLAKALRIPEVDAYLARVRRRRS